MKRVKASRDKVYCLDCRHLALAVGRGICMKHGKTVWPELPRRCPDFQPREQSLITDYLEVER